MKWLGHTSASVKFRKPELGTLIEMSILASAFEDCRGKRNLRTLEGSAATAAETPA